MNEPELQEKSFKETVEPTSLSKHEQNARSLTEIGFHIERIFLNDHIQDERDGTPYRL